MTWWSFVILYLSEDAEAVVVLLVASGAHCGNVAADLGGEEGAHRVPQPPGHAHPVPADQFIIRSFKSLIPA